MNSNGRPGGRALPLLAGVAAGALLTGLGLFIGGRQFVEQQVARLGASDSVAQQEDSSGNIAESRRTAIVRAAERAGPAVVSISVIQVMVARAPMRVNPNGDDLFDMFFPQYRRQEVPSLGSGILVRDDGIILTNDHVVRGAERIKVTLTDGREFDGEVKGSDQAYDLAVIRIHGDNLPVARLGDSDHLLIGEWAIAIGNPFGFLLNDTQPTVTAGVISAIHRDVKQQGRENGIYQDMIQTDASINPGNSGGPLVNSDGEVIGINTFIFTPSGGSVGIGFARPINSARRAMDEFLAYGRVRPIWIGVRVQEREMAVSGNAAHPTEDWVTVAVVDRGSPAEKAGLKIGDRIIGVNGREVHSAAEARRAIFGATVGDTVRVAVLRGKERTELALLVTEEPSS